MPLQPAPPVHAINPASRRHIDALLVRVREDARTWSLNETPKAS
jgi:hypothetical protein